VLDLKDQISGSQGLGEMDWKTVLIAGIFGLTATPEMRTAIMRGLGGLKLPGLTLPRPPGAPPTPSLPPGTPAGGQPPTSATPTVEGERPGVTPEIAEADQTLRGVIWPLLRKAIAKGSTEWDLYADLIEEHLPGFLQAWSAADFEHSLRFIEGIDPAIAAKDPATIAWLHGLHDFLRHAPPSEPEGDEP